jgi:ribosomal protein S18 acetylase RimI-like enzyme
VDNLEFREEPCAEDISRVVRLLSRTQFFSAEEVEIGTSLVTERLSEGVRCGYLFLFAESKDAFLGYSCYGPIPGTLNGYDLYWIAVDPDRQREGVGRQLLATTEQKILELGGQRLYAETSSTAQYQPTRLFYERNGFILEGRLANYYAPNDDKMLYTKILVKEPE